MRISDWSSDVCSSDLLHAGAVDRLALQSLGGAEFQHIAATAHIDRADVGAEGAGDDLDDAVEPGLRRAAAGHDVAQPRSAERPVGRECVSKRRSRGAPYHYNKTNTYSKQV